MSQAGVNIAGYITEHLLAAPEAIPPAAAAASAVPLMMNLPLSSPPWNSTVCSSPVSISSVNWMEACRGDVEEIC